MQFGGTPSGGGSRRRRLQLQNTYVTDDDYPHSLMLYNKPPVGDLTLEEFEQYGYDRVQVLHYLDSLGLSEIKGSEIYNEKLSNFLRKKFQGFINTSQDNLTERDLDWRKRDHISHFILRLAFCRSEELRKWFLEKEVDLFKFRFGLESSKSIETFLKLNKLQYSPISEGEKERYKMHLSLVTHDITLAKVNGLDFYKVPFTEVLNLVSSRRVFLSDGYAFVPQTDLVSIISSYYRENLSKALVIAARSLPQLGEEERLMPILRSFNKNAISTSYDSSKNMGKVSSKDLDELAKISMPLCMRQVHFALKEHHHLKHWSRMQYGLFLKAIGITLEDSLSFWRQEFAKGVGLEKFDKSYAYNIRHNYGKEGKRTNYTPYSCVAIITKNPPGVTDHHGCPFKHNSLAMLKQKLSRDGISKDDIEHMAQLIQGQHYQIACKKYFEITHKVADIGLQITHPNMYFDGSRKILTGEIEPIKSEGKENSFTPDWSQPLPHADISAKLTQTQKSNLTDMDIDDDVMNSYLNTMSE